VERRGGRAARTPARGLPGQDAGELRSSPTVRRRWAAGATDGNCYVSGPSPAGPTGRLVSRDRRNEAHAGRRPRRPCPACHDRALYPTWPARDVPVADVPHRDANGHVDGLVVLVTDVGEIKNAERARLRSEHMLAESQIAAHVGSWEAELDGEQRPGSLRWSD